MRKKNNYNSTVSIKSLLFIISFLFIACNNDTEPQETLPETETINSGKLTVYSEEAIADIMDTVINMYIQEYPDVEVTKETVNARRAMALLLSGDARVIILSRDYLKDEDSLMQAYGVPKHSRLPIADDALVFFTQRQFPLDTLNTAIIKDVLTSADVKLNNLFPELQRDVEFVTLHQNSSVYANLSLMAADSLPIKKNIRLFSSIDSVINYVENNSNAIGAAYLSHVVNNQNLKSLRLGFVDTTGAYVEATKPVHQSYIIQGKYPYIVTHYAYLREERRNLPFWFAMYISRETEAQKHFLDIGIVPRFARIQIIPEE